MVEPRSGINPIEGLHPIAATSMPPPISIQSVAGFRFDTPNQVHVWSVELDALASRLHHLRTFLSGDELEKSARFRFDRHRNRYIAAHGWMRDVLSRYLSLPPTRLQFGSGPKGKPFLTGDANSQALQFNMAHSEAMALLAISPAARIGVDVERVRPMPDAGELVSRFFSRREADQFRDLPADRKEEAFFNLWTRKEAWLKATGEGIAHLLAQVEVAFLPSEAARFLELPKEYETATGWSLSSFSPAPGYVGAMAVESVEANPLVRSWDTSLTQGLA